MKRLVAKCRPIAPEDERLAGETAARSESQRLGRSGSLGRARPANGWATPSSSSPAAASHLSGQPSEALARLVSVEFRLHVIRLDALVCACARPHQPKHARRGRLGGSPVRPPARLRFLSRSRALPPVGPSLPPQSAQSDGPAPVCVALCRPQSPTREWGADNQPVGWRPPAHIQLNIIGRWRR